MKGLGRRGRRWEWLYEGGLAYRASTHDARSHECERGTQECVRHQAIQGGSMSQGHARPYFEIANPEIANILQGFRRNLSVLDVGCGSGVHGAELKRIRGHRVVGVDTWEESIRKARTRLEDAYVADLTKPQLCRFF